MIFSFAKNENKIVIPQLKDVDVLCFFSTPHAIFADESLWWETLRGSLKLKRSVLILESEIPIWPNWDSGQRWEASDNWSWLTPRALSVISATYPETPKNLTDFKNFLRSSK